MSSPSAPPQPCPNQISGTSATHGAQAATGVFYGNVTFGNTGLSSATPPRPSRKPISTVPFRRDPDFVDRGDILSRIDEGCSQPAGRVALVGLGGVGKSQLAIEYAHRVKERSPDTWLFWIFASNAARVEAAFRGIAEKLALPSRNDGDVDVTRQVSDWLSDENNGRWLIILDGIDDLQTLHSEVAHGAERVSVARVVPQGDHGALLITSRNADVARELVGREQDILRVGQMGEKEAAELLRKKLATAPDNAEQRLLLELEYFPLAITQAAAYVNRQLGMTHSAYLRKIQASKSKTSLLEKNLPDVRRYENANSSILRTWQISFDQIKSERATAADLLSFMSFFNQQGIPRFILDYWRLHSANGLPSEHPGGLQEGDPDDDMDELNEDLAVLYSFSLISKTENGDEYDTHSLVQFATRTWLRSMQEEEKWWAGMVWAMAATFPEADFENWPTCRALLPHVPSVSERLPHESALARAWTTILINSGRYALRQGLASLAQDLIGQALGECERRWGDEDDQTIELLDLLGSALREKGLYEEAEEMKRRALGGTQKRLGSDHPRTLIAMNNFGSVLQVQGKYEEAEAICRDLLSGGRETPGREDLDTLGTLNNLAVVLAYRGLHAEAEEKGRQALEGYIQNLGDDHPDTLTAMDNVAFALQVGGQYKEAEEINRRALARKEVKLRENHPHLLRSMDNLAQVLQQQGRFGEAGEIKRQTLAAREVEQGNAHPETLLSMGDLAVLLERQGRYHEAEELNRRALAGKEKSLGAGHPETLTTMLNLAAALADQQKHEEAEELGRRALAGFEQELGPAHPHNLLSLQNLASLLAHRGQHEEAEKLARSALDGSTATLGDDHPQTVVSMRTLTEVLQQRGKYEEAEDLGRRALVVSQELLGPSHPYSLASLESLAAVQYYQDKFEEAEDMSRRATEISMETFGPDHPTTLRNASNLARTLERQGRFEEALERRRMTLAAVEAKLGKHHPDTLMHVNALANVLSHLERWDEARTLLERSCSEYWSGLGESHPTTVACQQLLSDLLSPMRITEEGTL